MVVTFEDCGNPKSTAAVRAIIAQLAILRRILFTDIKQAHDTGQTGQIIIVLLLGNNHAVQVGLPARVSGARFVYVRRLNGLL